MMDMGTGSKPCCEDEDLCVCEGSSVQGSTSNAVSDVCLSESSPVSLASTCVSAEYASLSEVVGCQSSSDLDLSNQGVNEIEHTGQSNSDVELGISDHENKENIEQKIDLYLKADKDLSDVENYKESRTNRNDVNGESDMIKYDMEIISGENFLDIKRNENVKCEKDSEEKEVLVERNTIACNICELRRQVLYIRMLKKSHRSLNDISALDKIMETCLIHRTKSEGRENVSSESTKRKRNSKGRHCKASRDGHVKEMLKGDLKEHDCEPAKQRSKRKWQDRLVGFEIECNGRGEMDGDTKQEAVRSSGRPKRNSCNSSVEIEGNGKDKVDEVAKSRGPRRNAARLKRNSCDSSVDSENQSSQGRNSKRLKRNSIDESEKSEKKRTKVDLPSSVLNGKKRKEQTNTPPAIQSSKRKRSYCKNGSLSLPIVEKEKCDTDVSKTVFQQGLKKRLSSRNLTSTPNRNSKLNQSRKECDEQLEVGHFSLSDSSKAEKAGDHEEEYIPFSTLQSSSVSFDVNVDKDLCEASVDETLSEGEDSDEDLPEGLTPVKHETSLSVGALVWVKWKRLPYLPALVKCLYKKRKRVTLVPFVPKDKPEPLFSMSYSGKDRVIPFYDEKRQEIMKGAEELSKADREYFSCCSSRVEDFLVQKALGNLKGGIFSFFSKDELADNEIGPEDESEAADNSVLELGVTEADQSSVVITKVTKSKEKELSKKGKLRKEKMNKDTEPLTSFLVSKECKRHLINILKGKEKSELHTIFASGTANQKKEMKHMGFGPIDDEDQINTILETYMDWLSTINQSPYLSVVNYVFDVWVPEAIVFGLRKLKRCTAKKAWEKFHKGVRRTKEELQLIHETMLNRSYDKKEPFKKLILPD